MAARGAGSAGPDKRKLSLYFREEMLRDIAAEAARLDRSLSWVMQRAWQIARKDLRRIPSVDEPVSAEEEAKVAAESKRRGRKR